MIKMTFEFLNLQTGFYSPASLMLDDNIKIFSFSCTGWSSSALLFFPDPKGREVGRDDWNVSGAT